MLSFVGILISIGLIFIQGFFIQKWCFFCIVSGLIMIIIWILSVFYLRKMITIKQLSSVSLKSYFPVIKQGVMITLSIFCNFQFRNFRKSLSRPSGPSNSPKGRPSPSTPWDCTLSSIQNMTQNSSSHKIFTLRNPILKRHRKYCYFATRYDTGSCPRFCSSHFQRYSRAKLHVWLPK